MSFMVYRFSRGRRWWTRSCTQSASPTVWRSSLWKTQDSNRRFLSVWYHHQSPHNSIVHCAFVFSPCSPCPIWSTRLLHHLSFSPLLCSFLSFSYPLFHLSLRAHLFPQTHSYKLFDRCCCVDLRNSVSPPFFSLSTSTVHLLPLISCLPVAVVLCLHWNIRKLVYEHSSLRLSFRSAPACNSSTGRDTCRKFCIKFIGHLR